MTITVHLHSKLMVETAEGLARRLDVVLVEGSTVTELIAQLKISIEPEMLLIGINGNVAKLEDKLHEGDHVHLMLPVSGGI